MSTQSEKLISLLKKLFQSDQAELDFGMYKVINQRRDEINRFLEEKLLPQIKDAFSTYQSVDTDILQNELKQAMRQAEDLGVDPETSSKVKGIREQIATYSVDVSDLENQVFSALYNFFRRYYDEGDFISQRRYKEGVYAIPYEGEEVKLYWANHDQYYIKTSEYFRDYSFKLPPGKHAHFKLVEADTEKDNRKEIDDNKRRFVLAEEPLEWQDGEVVIHFEFRPEKANQAKCNEETLKTIYGLRKGLDEQSQKDALTQLAHPAPTETNPDRTVLEKHLEDYTRRNTQDYFIHKDLGKFLRRELDFYIKNEVMHLDNIENESTLRVEEYLSKIKVIRQIAHKIIDFLAQIENYQKRLWLKKKFVVETNYCITLNRIPEELFPEIITNDAQREEWVRLFHIDQIDGFCKPLDVEFLLANKNLLLDTKYFKHEFKYKILGTMHEIDKEINGIIIESENFQALNLFKEKYKQNVDYVYIDPPYNRPGTDSEILYKNDYPNSTWLSLMSDRLFQAKHLFTPKTPITIAIDDHELANLSKLMEVIYPEYEIQIVVVSHYPGSGSGRGNISRTHEYALFAIPIDQDILLGKQKEEGERIRGFRRSGIGENNYRVGRPNSFYAVLVNPETLEIVDLEEPPEATENNYPSKDTSEGFVRVYPIGEDGSERVWTLSYEGGLLALENEELICSENFVIKRIYNDEDSREILTSLWSNTKFNAATYGTNLLTDILGESGLFTYPKSVFTVSTSIDASCPNNKNAIVLDFFAGSGTTGHAVIKLNREDGGNRKYLLVEMGQYFNSVLKPRIQRVIYSEDWKKGKPIVKNTVSHVFKYLQLESFEDSLNNITLKRPESAQATLLDKELFGEDYLLQYMLDFESQRSLLNLERFETPFDYQLQIASNTVGETEATPVDLVETFNYLLGLHVHSLRKIEGAVVVRGRTRDEKQVLVIWRTVSEMDNNQLNAFFEEHLADGSEEITDIYVNGDNNLANSRQVHQHWKVHLTEESFQRLMFAG
jgi:adenine-specific DNA-methyltransferase